MKTNKYPIAITTPKIDITGELMSDITAFYFKKKQKGLIDNDYLSKQSAAIHADRALLHSFPDMELIDELFNKYTALKKALCK